MEPHAQIVIIGTQRIALLSESDYLKLLDKAGRTTAEFTLPPLPRRLPNGNYPALEYARASIARKIIRARQRLGLTQAELARRAGLAIPFLNRLERGSGNPTIATIDKIDRALRAAEKKKNKHTDT